MNIISKKTNNIEEVADFVVASISKQLESGKKVLLFLTGGSSVSVGVKIGELLKGHSLQGLTIMLTDERYVPKDHFNSNYFQLLEKGFSLTGVKFIPILVDEDINITTEKFDKNLEEELQKAEYKIGLFGVGADGHTAGILPESFATQSDKFACSYETSVFSRITMTFKAIEKLDEAVVFAQGETKWPVLKDLIEKEIDVIKQPAQILKKVPLLTIFSDA